MIKIKVLFLIDNEASLILIKIPDLENVLRKSRSRTTIYMPLTMRMTMPSSVK